MAYSNSRHHWNKDYWHTSTDPHISLLHKWKMAVSSWNGSLYSYKFSKEVMLRTVFYMEHTWKWSRIKSWIKLYILCCSRYSNAVSSDLSIKLVVVYICGMFNLYVEIGEQVLSVSRSLNSFIFFTWRLKKCSFAHNNNIFGLVSKRLSLTMCLWYIV